MSSLQSGEVMELAALMPVAFRYSIDPHYFHIRLNTDKGLAVRFAWLCLLSSSVKVAMIQHWVLLH